MIRLRKRYELDTNSQVDLRKLLETLRKTLCLNQDDIVDIELVAGKLSVRVTCAVPQSELSRSMLKLEPGVELLP